MQDKLTANAASISIPVLALQGTADKIVAAEELVAFVNSMRSVDKSTKLYDGARHNIFQDSKAKDQAVADLLEWLNKRTK